MKPFVERLKLHNVKVHFFQPLYKQLALGWLTEKTTFMAQTSFTKQQKKLQFKEKWSFSFEINLK